METVGLGLYFEDLPVGRRFKTIGRTVTEADITNFVNCTGMVEVLFTNTEFLEHESDIKGRLAPGALVYCLCRGAARAIDDAAHRLRLPAHGIDGREPGRRRRHDPRRMRDRRGAPLSKSRPGRGLVRTRVRVVKQDGAVALVYTPLRMVKCRDG